MQRQTGTGPIATIADFRVAISVKETGYSWQLGALVQPDTSATGAPRENWITRKRKWFKAAQSYSFHFSTGSVAQVFRDKLIVKHVGSQKSKDKLYRLSGHATNQRAVTIVLLHVPILLPTYGRPNFNAAGGPPEA